MSETVQERMNHPRVRAYLDDLDLFLRQADPQQRAEAQQWVKERLKVEFAQVAPEAPLEGVVQEALMRLGPTSQVASQLGITSPQEPAVGQLTWYSWLAAILLPFTLGLSGIWSAFLLARSLRLPRRGRRQSLVVLNAIALAIGLFLVVCAVVGIVTWQKAGSWS